MYGRVRYEVLLRKEEMLSRLRKVATTVESGGDALFVVTRQPEDYMHPPLTLVLFSIWMLFYHITMGLSILYHRKYTSVLDSDSIMYSKKPPRQSLRFSGYSC